MASGAEEIQRLSAEIATMEAAVNSRARSSGNADPVSSAGPGGAEAQGEEENARIAQRLRLQVARDAKEREALQAILENKIQVLADSLVRIVDQVLGGPAQGWEQVEGRVGRELRKLQFLVDAAASALRTPSGSGIASQQLQASPFRTITNAAAASPDPARAAGSNSAREVWDRVAENNPNAYNDVTVEDLEGSDGGADGPFGQGSLGGSLQREQRRMAQEARVGAMLAAAKRKTRPLTIGRAGKGGLLS